MNQTVEAIAAIVAGIIGVAIVAVLVSSNAKTSDVISSSGSALAGVIKAAVQPVAGGSTSGV